jgi:sortase A
VTVVDEPVDGGVALPPPPTDRPDPGHRPEQPTQASREQPSLARKPSRLAALAGKIAAPARPGRSRTRLVVAVWILVGILCFVLVLYTVEPMFQQSNQKALLDSYTAQIDKATKETQGLPGVSASSKAPEMGSPVAVLEIGSIRLRQVVVEGASSGRTQVGPGHVPGTAAPGQPGNSVVVARRAMFGGPFANLSKVAEGDKIVVTTTQGPSIYTVDSVEEKTISEPKANAGSAATGGAASGSDSVTVDELYGKSDDDRITLVTSTSVLPWNSSKARVIVATMEGQPYQPTVQNGRSSSQTGTTGDTGAWAGLLIALQLLVLTVIGAVWLYRRSTVRTAYLLTVPPLLVFTILTAEAASRLLPAWA